MLTETYLKVTIVNMAFDAIIIFKNIFHKCKQEKKVLTHTKTAKLSV